MGVLVMLIMMFISPHDLCLYATHHLYLLPHTTCVCTTTLHTEVTVRIIKVDTVTNKLSLSIKQAQEHPMKDAVHDGEEEDEEDGGMDGQRHGQPDGQTSEEEDEDLDAEMARAAALEGSSEDEEEDEEEEEEGLDMDESGEEEEAGVGMDTDDDAEEEDEDDEEDDDAGAHGDDDVDVQVVPELEEVGWEEELEGEDDAVHQAGDKDDGEGVYRTCSPVPVCVHLIVHLVYRTSSIYASHTIYIYNTTHQASPSSPLPHTSHPPTLPKTTLPKSHRSPPQQASQTCRQASSQGT